MGYRKVLFFFALFLLANAAARADELLYGYEGNVLPYHPSAGWLNGLCKEPCRESLIEGYLVLDWPTAGDIVNYHHWIARPPMKPPVTLWVEWRFRSNHLIPRHSYSCDAWFTIDYARLHEVVYLYADAAVSHSGDHAILGLVPEEFHTYRFECFDRTNYWISVDGKVFIEGVDFNDNAFHYLQFGGIGGCNHDQILNAQNEWDFIRYGTIDYGERILASDPPAGFLDPDDYPALDRFTVTFDSPNYIYIHEIAVEVTGGVAPTVVQTRRLDNGPPETVEIVLDKPIPLNARTRFTFNDGAVTNVVSYTYIQGDVDADDDFDLFDFAAFQNCYGLQGMPNGLPNACAAFDFNHDSLVASSDAVTLVNLLTGP